MLLWCPFPGPDSSPFPHGSCSTGAWGAQGQQRLPAGDPNTPCLFLDLPQPFRELLCDPLLTWNHLPGASCFLLGP